MGIIRFDPYRGFEHVAKRMQQAMSDLEKGFSIEQGAFNPKVDIQETNKDIKVYVELPGLSKEDVKISFNEEGILSIKGKKEKESQEKNINHIKQERSYGEFSRTFLLPENIDQSSVKAKFNNGLLEVNIMKKEPEQPKEYNINIE
jgi:HSP20 family protein